MKCAICGHDHYGMPRGCWECACIDTALDTDEYAEWRDARWQRENDVSTALAAPMFAVYGGPR